MKKILKLKKRHPNNQIRLGSHTITNAAKEFELNQDELKELSSVGGVAWITEIIKEEKEKPARTKK